MTEQTTGHASPITTDETTITKSAQNVISVKANGITSSKIANGEIVDADINSSANISLSKLSADVIADNDANGITPTASGWNTTPALLGSLTDGKMTPLMIKGDSNATSEDNCYIDVDLGSVLTTGFVHVINEYFQLGSSGTQYLKIKVSHNGSTWTTIQSFSSSAGGNEKYTGNQINGWCDISQLANGCRYIRITVWTSNSSYHAFFSPLEIFVIRQG